MVVLEARGITKIFSGVEVLKGIDITLEEGQFFGLFGPNGAGKTTLLRILSGQLFPSSGGAKILDVDVAANPVRAKELIGILPEVESPPSYLTPREFLYFVGKVRKLRELNERIAHLIEFFELDGAIDTVCKDLSRGTRQKLMLAAAILHEPKLLMLDEPFINLDPVYQRRVKDYLLDFVDEGGTIFMCSHLLDIAEKLCDTVAIIRQGSIIAQGPLASLKSDGEDLEAVFLRLVGVKP